MSFDRGHTTLPAFECRFGAQAFWVVDLCGPMVMAPKRTSGRPKQPTTENLPISNLYLDWESVNEIRDRLLDGGSLLISDKGGEDIPTCVANTAVLQPLITRMSLLQTKPLPAVDPLRDEIEAVYQKCKRGNHQDDSPDVVAICWRIRKLLGFVKMKVRRREVSSVPLMHIRIKLYILSHTLYKTK